MEYSHICEPSQQLPCSESFRGISPVAVLSTPNPDMAEAIRLLLTTLEHRFETPFPTTVDEAVGHGHNPRKSSKSTIPYREHHWC
ncbi:hypothetical protein X797_007522 [Metarhizium robertsii]|uniref:Uncharacterized protein n=1 Tax=Metarhizium robertsii TaxID=568076 RepID=A0A014P830_9HYPO|nr:hypothetical protein X797_007522 [Metarhizium robertsii]